MQPLPYKFFAFRKLCHQFLERSQVPDGPDQDQAGNQTCGVKANEPDEELTPVPERKAFSNCSIRRLSRHVRRAISRFT